MKPDRVGKKTLDRIELITSGTIHLGGLFFTAVGIMAILCMIFIETSEDLFIRIFIVIMGGGFLWIGLWFLLCDRTVIINKRNQDIQIISKSLFNKSVTDIPFSDVQNIKTEVYEDEDYYSCDIELFTRSGPITIYYGHSETGIFRI